MVLDGCHRFSLAIANMAAKTDTAPAVLKKWREDAGLSQGKAGQLVRVSAATWCDWENGKKDPRTDRAEDLEELTDRLVTIQMWAAWARARRAARRRRKRAA